MENEFYEFALEQFQFIRAHAVREKDGDLYILAQNFFYEKIYPKSNWVQVWPEHSWSGTWLCDHLLSPTARPMRVWAAHEAKPGADLMSGEEMLAAVRGQGEFDSRAVHSLVLFPFSW